MDKLKQLSCQAKKSNFEMERLERKQDLDTICNDDAALMERVKENPTQSDTDDLSFTMRSLMAVVHEDLHQLADEMDEDQAQALIGSTLGHYQILEKLGEGGMGVVYLARDTQLKREIALKVLPDHLAIKPESLRRFKREGKTIAALDHPGIVTIHSVEEADSRHFYTMEYIQGQTLAQVIKKGPMPITHFLKLAVLITQALAAAHDRGIIHRDIKPANIMITSDDSIKILDFGLAKLNPRAHAFSSDAPQSSTLTQDGRIMGTVHYMSPEQIKGKPVDHRSDLFSLGVIFYQMLAATRPFDGETSSDVISSVLRDEPLAPAALRHDLPIGLNELIQQCIHKDVGNRPDRAKDILIHLSEMEPAGYAVKLMNFIAEYFRLRKHPGFILAAALMIIITTFTAYEHKDFLESRIRYYKAIHFYGDRNAKAAASLLKTVVDLDPEFAPAYSRLSNYLSGLGLRKEAWHTIKKGYKLRDNFGQEDRLLITAEYLMHSLQYEKAKKSLEQIISFNKDNDFALRQLAHCASVLHQPEQARQYLQRAQNLNPENVFNAGLELIVMVEQGLFESALIQLKAIRQRFPQDYYPYWGEGLALLGLDEMQNASLAFSKLERGGEPYSSWGQLLKAKTMIMEGRLQPAIQLLADTANQDAATQNFDNAMFRNYLSIRAWMGSGKKEQARNHIRSLKELDLIPGNIRIMRRMALLHLELDQPMIADYFSKNLNQLAAVYPSVISHASAAQVRGVLAAYHNRLDLAERELRDARQTWNDPLIIESLGALFHKKGAYDQAIEMYELFLSRKGWILRNDDPSRWVQTHLKLAQIYSDSGRLHMAQKHLQRYQKSWPASTQSMPVNTSKTIN